LKMRKERDLIGEEKIPENAYWGIHTYRALKNFKITGRNVNKLLIEAFGYVKKACCITNLKLGYLDKKKAEAIVLACEDLIQGKLHEHIVVDALQGGAGTSTNMNINEVIANRAIEILGGKKGDYSIVHPIEDVNMHQSTNDVYPTALKIASLMGLHELEKNVAELQGILQKKEREFANILKIGRTEMQEAVPMTLGQEFSAFAEAIARDRWRIFKCRERIRVINLGGTAIGTGITCPKKYIFLVNEIIRDITKLNLARAENMVEATANYDSFSEVSGILKAHADNLIRIANNIRLMNMLKEIKLPVVQAGSSIMPGKVNPVIAESIIQVGFTVRSNDLLISECVSNGTFQINEFAPLIADAFLNSLGILINANSLFKDYIKGIECQEDLCAKNFDDSLTIITAFLPYIGYDKASEFVKEYNGKKERYDSFKAFLIEKLGEEKVKNVLSPQNLYQLGYKENKKIEKGNYRK